MPMILWSVEKMYFRRNDSSWASVCAAGSKETAEVAIVIP